MAIAMSVSVARASVVVSTVADVAGTVIVFCENPLLTVL